MYMGNVNSVKARHAARVATRTQRQWSDEHVARCKKNELDKDRRVKTPALFTEDLPQNEPESDLEDVGELTTLNINLMSSILILPLFRRASICINLFRYRQISYTYKPCIR